MSTSRQSLSKAQWETIKDALLPHYGAVKLQHNGNEILLHKRQTSENSLTILVYINGYADYSWGIPSRGEFTPEFKQYMSGKKMRRYSLKFKRETIKAYGKRRAFKEFNLDEYREYWYPQFSTFSTLKGVFNKLDGLTLVATGSDALHGGEAAH